MSKKTLAELVHEAWRLTDSADQDLAQAVTDACGPTGDNDEDIRTDGYDNSIEVWGVDDIDLDEAARKLRAHGFARVWLHQHLDRTNCKCPLRMEDKP